MEKLQNILGKLGKINIVPGLFFICGCFDIFIYVYNVLTVSISYGFVSIWQPIVTNADKLGFAAIYFLLWDRTRTYREQKKEEEES